MVLCKYCSTIYPPVQYKRNIYVVPVYDYSSETFCLKLNSQIFNFKLRSLEGSAAQEMSTIFFGLVLTAFALSQTEAEPGTFDYMVDCSACQHTPIINIKSYTCAVRCELEGEYWATIRWWFTNKFWENCTCGMITH